MEAALSLYLSLPTRLLPYHSPEYDVMAVKFSLAKYVQVALGRNNAGETRREAGAHRCGFCSIPVDGLLKSRREARSPTEACTREEVVLCLSLIHI